MGSKSSKKQKNDELKKIGEEANKSSPSSFSTYTSSVWPPDTTKAING